MAKDLDSKCKLCRRAGEKLFLKGERCSSAKCVILKRNYPPGQHGIRNRRFLTNYGKQLQEKQKAKRIYGLLEKQFKNYYLKAVKKQGNTGELLLQLLEMRFDNIIYRTGLAKSRRQARQMINHGHFTINGRKVNIPSYQVKAKDEIAIKANKSNIKNFENVSKALEKIEMPDWLKFDVKELKAKVASKPTLDELKPQFNPTLIVEFYSR